MSEQGGSRARILVFVPMYNCAPQIGRVVAQFDDQVIDATDHLLLVDNRSTDDTLAKAQEAMRGLDRVPVTLVRNNANYGLGGSHKVAFDFALRHDFDYLVVLHGDDQGSIKELLPQLASGAHLQADALLGARFMPGSQLRGYSKLRIFGNEVFNRIFGLVGGQRIYDLGSGLNLFRVRAFADGFFLEYGDDLTFNYSLILGLLGRKMRIRFFPISWREDDQVSNVKLVRQTMKMLRILWDYMLRPERFIVNRTGWLSTHGYRSTVIAERAGAGQGTPQK